MRRTQRVLRVKRLPKVLEHLLCKTHKTRQTNCDAIRAFAKHIQVRSQVHAKIALLLYPRRPRRRYPQVLNLRGLANSIMVRSCEQGSLMSALQVRVPLPSLHPQIRTIRNAQFRKKNGESNTRRGDSRSKDPTHLPPIPPENSFRITILLTIRQRMNLYNPLLSPLFGNLVFVLFLVKPSHRHQIPRLIPHPPLLLSPVSPPTSHLPQLPHQLVQFSLATQWLATQPHTYSAFLTPLLVVVVESML